MKSLTAAWIGLAIFGLSALWPNSQSPAAAQPGTPTPQRTGAETAPPPSRAPGQPVRATDAAVEAALAKTLPELKLQAVSFRDAIEQFRLYLGVNLHVFWDSLADAGVEPDRRITLALNGVTAERALRLILDEAVSDDPALGYQIDDGVLIIDTQRRLDSRLVTEVFNVQELLLTPLDHAGNAPPWRFSPPAMAAAPAAPGMPPMEFPRQTPTATPRDNAGAPAGERLVALIAASVEPDSWEASGGRGSARVYNGVLVVRQPLRIQRQVAQLLEALRVNEATPAWEP
jgi:hypothetical protein